MTVVRQPNGDGHAVLTVRTDRADYVLDNLEERVLQWNETEYQFLKRQSAANSGRWEGIDDNRNRSSAACKSSSGKHQRRQKRKLHDDDAGAKAPGRERPRQRRPSRLAAFRRATRASDAERMIHGPAKVQSSSDHKACAGEPNSARKPACAMLRHR